MADKPQSYENHAKLVPMFHFVALPILMINFLIAAYEMVTTFSFGSVRFALVSLALVIGVLLARVFALGAQDRVIRLEERIRMQRLLPDDLQARINDFTTEQLIGLRFASDEELPELARKVLDEGTAERKPIKQMIKTWRPDLQRL